MLGFLFAGFMPQFWWVSTTASTRFRVQVLPRSCIHGACCCFFSHFSVFTQGSNFHCFTWAHPEVVVLYSQSRFKVHVWNLLFVFIFFSNTIPSFLYQFRDLEPKLLIQITVKIEAIDKIWKMRNNASRLDIEPLKLFFSWYKLIPVTGYNGSLPRITSIFVQINITLVNEMIGSKRYEYRGNPYP